MVIQSSFGPKPHNFGAIKACEPASKFDFSIFAGCFGKRFIRPSDIDFVVERRGKFLVGEFKGRAGRVSQGQAILLDRLSELPNATVFLAYGSPPDRIDAWECLNNGARGADLDSLRAFMAEWYASADRN